MYNAFPVLNLLLFKKNEHVTVNLLTVLPPYHVKVLKAVIFTTKHS